MIIFNTLQSAAIFASSPRTICAVPTQVGHLATPLSPHDRTRTLERITFRLRNRNNTDWLLDATRCVEVGTDFSFRTAFRESCGLVNLLQISGRVNRCSEYNDAEVWDFRHGGNYASGTIVRESGGNDVSIDVMHVPMPCGMISACGNVA